MPGDRVRQSWLQRLGTMLRRVCGMPDYDAHVAHLRRHHPDRPVPGRREFFEMFVRSRYGDGPTRCC